MADVEVKNEGPVVLLIPMSDRGEAWIDDNLQLEGWQWYGNAAAVEARYADPIVLGMQDDGLEVEGTTRVIPEEHDITPEQEEEAVRRGILPPMGKRSAKRAQEVRDMVWACARCCKEYDPKIVTPGGVSGTCDLCGREGFLRAVKFAAVRPQAPPEGTPAADVGVDPWGEIAQAMSGQPEEEQTPSAPRRPIRHTVEPEIPGGPYHMVGADGRGFRSAFLRQPRKDGYCDACDRPEAQCVCSPEDCDLTGPKAS